MAGLTRITPREGIMPNRIDVSRMLGSLDSDPFGRVVESILLSAADSKLSAPLKKSVAMVQDRLKDAKTPVITIEQARFFERLAPPSFGILRIDRPAFIETLLVGVHSRATELLRTSGSRAILDDLTELPARVKAGLERMEPGVVGEFLIETAIGAARSSEVNQRLVASAEAIRSRIPGLSGLEKQGKALLRPKGGPDECECIVSGCNGYGDCQNFCIDSWWECILILIGIIIIIILAG
jgi:hypothetical protein